MNSYTEIVNSALEYCKTKCSELVYKLWINVVELARVDNKNNTVYLYVSDTMKKEVIETKYLDLFNEAFTQVFGFDVSVVILLRDEEPTFEREPKTRILDVSLSSGYYEYTFDTFIEGPSNRLAFSGAKSLANGEVAFNNPLFIYGPSGLGKTHLTLAIKHDIETKFPHKKVIYVKGDDFTNELIDAIENKSTRAFHDKYRSIDVLLVDDIHFIAGKERTQEEFFNTFNTLYLDKKQIVLTSDRPPKEINTLNERLRTRFEQGLMADINPPEFETRIAIVKRKAKLLDLPITDDIAEFIAERLKKNIRQLEGTVKKLKAYQQLEKLEPSIALAQRAINDVVSNNQPISVTVDKIISEVARTFDVSAIDVKGKKRDADISNARHTAIYIVKEILNMSHVNIGKNFGDRNHATIVHSLKEVSNQMKNNPKYKATVEDIINNLRE